MNSLPSCSGATRCCSANRRSHVLGRAWTCTPHATLCRMLSTWCALTPFRTCYHLLLLNNSLPSHPASSSDLNLHPAHTHPVQNAINLVRSHPISPSTTTCCCSMTRCRQPLGRACTSPTCTTPSAQNAINLVHSHPSCSGTTCCSSATGCPHALNQAAPCAPLCAERHQPGALTPHMGCTCGLRRHRLPLCAAGGAQQGGRVQGVGIELMRAGARLCSKVVQVCGQH